MGFNKGIISKERIRQSYLDGGYKSVIKMLNAYDAFYIKDDFSNKVIKSYNEGKLKEFFDGESE